MKTKSTRDLISIFGPKLNTSLVSDAANKIELETMRYAC